MGFLENILGQKMRPHCSVVIVAAGLSTRMGENKMKLSLSGMPVLARTLKVFQSCSDIDEIIVVVGQDEVEDTAYLCRDYGIDKATKVMIGGSTRAESALIGLLQISQKAELAAIHDGARPLITCELISSTIKTAQTYRAAAPAVPVRDTVKETDGGEMVVNTPDRTRLMAVQTPQIFEPDLIKAALTDAIRKGISITDDCSAVEALGIKVRLTEGSEENIKLTTPLDVKIAEAILTDRERRQ